jgi:hypothetical protein
MEAASFLRKKLEAADKGVSPSSDRSSLHYGDLRKLYLTHYAEQEHKSLMTNVETDEVYVCGLKHLDKFFGYEKDGDTGLLAKYISVARIDEFKAARKAEAENGTVNRSLAALRRMRPGNPGKIRRQDRSDLIQQVTRSTLPDNEARPTDWPGFCFASRPLASAFQANYFAVDNRTAAHH